jgi:hypothetical protein
MKLKIAAKVDRVDQGYFKEQIKPLLTQPDVEFVGEITEAEKTEFPRQCRRLGIPDRLARTVRAGDDRSDGLWNPGCGYAEWFGAGGR